MKKKEYNTKNINKKEIMKYNFCKRQETKFKCQGLFWIFKMEFFIIP